jgi:hypothetical protein
VLDEHASRRISVAELELRQELRHRRLPADLALSTSFASSSVVSAFVFDAIM